MAMKRTLSTGTPSPRAASSPSCITFRWRTRSSAPARPSRLYGHTRSKWFQLRATRLPAIQSTTGCTRSLNAVISPVVSAPSMVVTATPARIIRTGDVPNAGCQDSR